MNGYATAQTSSLMFRCTCGLRPNDTLNTNPPSGPTSRLDQHLLPKPKFVPRNGTSEDVPRHLSEPVSQRRQFLAGLSYLMITKRTPLPSTLTGVPILTYDPHTSPWRFLTISTRGTGIIRLGGQDVDLYKLWISVFQAGGHEKVCKIDGIVRNIALTGSFNDSCQERARGVRYSLPSTFRPNTSLPY